MESAAQERAAALLAKAFTSRTFLKGFPGELKPATLADAYGIQDRLISMLDAVPAGWKVGASNEEVQRRLEFTEPFYGRMFAGQIHTSPVDLPASAFFRRALEIEFAFRMATDLPPSGAPYDRDTVAAAVGELMPAIEICDSRYQDYPPPPFEIVADNGVHGAFVAGDPVAGWRDLDLVACEATITVNGEIKGNGRGADVLGDPLNSLAWLANALAARGSGLAAGEIVTTGTMARAVWAEPGDRAVADFGPCGSVAVAFTT